MTRPGGCCSNRPLAAGVRASVFAVTWQRPTPERPWFEHRGLALGWTPATHEGWTAALVVILLTGLAAELMKDSAPRGLEFLGALLMLALAWGAAERGSS